MIRRDWGDTHTVSSQPWGDTTTAGGTIVGGQLAVEDRKLSFALTKLLIRPLGAGCAAVLPDASIQSSRCPPAVAKFLKHLHRTVVQGDDVMALAPRALLKFNKRFSLRSLGELSHVLS